MGKLKLSLAKTAANLILLGLSISVIPISSAQQVSQSTSNSDPTRLSHLKEMKVIARASEEPKKDSPLTMSGEQQYWLLSQMENQAGYRRKIKRTAFLALTELQQLAIDEEFDPTRAKQLAEIYGMALAKLTLMNIHLASKLRTILSPSQRKTLEDSIERRRLLNDLKL
jgi:hypothetical protein